MSATFFVACVLIVCYLVIERRLREGRDALSLNPTEADRGSSQFIWIVGLFSLFLLLLAPLLNENQVGCLDSSFVARSGIFLMATGLVLRYWAAKILGRFYTRTLRIVEEQELIEFPPYNIVRHPGYLGTLLIELGAALAINNYIIISIVAIAGVVWRIYRIQVEEEMLGSFFGKQYQAYRNKTWRLIPLLY